MLGNANIYHATNITASAAAPFLAAKAYIAGGELNSVKIWKYRSGSSNVASGVIAAGANNGGVVRTIKASAEKAVKVKGSVTVKMTVGGLVSNLGITRGLDDISDLLGKSLLLELVASELDPRTGLEKETVKAYAHRKSQKGNEVKYEADFKIPRDFGVIGAIIVENEHHKEMYVTEIIIDGLPRGSIHFNCNSFIHSKFDNPDNRVFFSNKSYLPSQTPEGLKRMRELQLVAYRGDGHGERKKFEQIYDYDTYNDLGDPDSDPELKRPVLGGKTHPYPRRCRTGRSRCKTDPASETKSSSVYVPRDEQFSEAKELTFSFNTVYSVIHALVPSLETAFVDTDLGFPYFTAIESLFNEGVNLPPLEKHNSLQEIMPRLLKSITDGSCSVMKFETPELFERDRFCWVRDEEFSRQTLAGLNPYSIKLVSEWPLKSSLDPSIYGPPESAITSELIQKEIGGVMTFHEAMKQKKLFMLDYHDALLPYVNEVRKLKGTTLYGSRALFFLTPEETLKPVAIELVRPPCDEKPQWKEVYTPGYDGTKCWLWRMAKSHVLAHDAGYHQLVSHWLRTHCCVEPYVIATNRQLSPMHPIFRLLHPHFRYTMEINALARQALINAGGIIESSFAPGKYSIELSSALYGQQWRFDREALPADLISRGLAEEDPSAPHGLKLAIKDYPFANDGLVLWDILKEWVTDYVNHYYPNASMVQEDEELQAWWDEIKNKGHGDKKDEPWWPNLKTPEDLIGILTIMIWVPSGHHAAVNFGQYTYAGYFPNRPTVVRMNMPNEDPKEEDWNFFLEKPEAVILASFPSQIQATRIMAILDILSSHSPEEEYLGEKPEPSWAEDAAIKAAFEKFSGRLKDLEGIIDARNNDRKLLNRSGAGVVPYELLKPYSEPGVTARGVPNSISI